MCCVHAAQSDKLCTMARVVGFEPTTNRLTADCSTAELHPNNPRAEDTLYKIIKTL